MQKPQTAAPSKGGPLDTAHLFESGQRPALTKSLKNSLIKEMQSLTPTGFPHQIIAIDQEGGRVCRLKNDFPNLGPALHLENGRIDQDALENIKIGRAHV